MKEDRNKVHNCPNLRFKEFEGEWNERRLGEMCNLITKGTTPKQFADASGICYIKIEAFEENFINAEKCVFIDEYTHNTELKRSILEENDILFAIAGATIGKTSIVTKGLLPANTNQALAIIRLKETINRNFILQILKSPIMQKYIQNNISVGAQPNLNLEQMNNFLFACPSFVEQSKIANFLSLLDDRISTQSQTIEKLQSLIKGLIHSFIKGKGSNIPLKDCLDCHSSTLMESAVIEKSGIYPVYGATGIIAYTTDYEIDKDAILIIKDGASVGKVQYAKDKYSVIGTLNYLTSRENVSLKYLYYYLQTFNFDKYKVGSGIPHIYFKDYSNENIYCPSIEKQNEIANLLSTIDEKLETEKQILTKYTEQKKYLLANLFI